MALEDHEQITDVRIRIIESKIKLVENEIKMRRLRTCLLMIRDAKPPAGIVFPAEWFEGYARQIATQALED